MKKTTIANGESIEDLSKDIKLLEENGWESQGGVSVACDPEYNIFAQTMTRETKPEGESPWIRVGDWLPEDTRTVLILDTKLDIFRGYWLIDEWLNAYSEKIEHTDITHWMPIPELPEAKK